MRRGPGRVEARRVHAMVLEVPGWEDCRMRVEADSARRGWMPALSPADADLLVVCGVPSIELEAVRDRVWGQLPGPRAQAAIVEADSVSTALNDAADRLIDTGWQSDDARKRARHGSSAAPGHPAESAPHDQAMPMVVPAPMSEDTTHDNMDMSGHDNMDMSGHDNMDMSPGGIPLASGDDDRDGLEMDLLNVPFGPALPYWPAGLVMWTVLHGDVIAKARVQLLGAGANPQGVGVPAESSSDGKARRRAIQLLDDACTLLSLAGWPSGASAAVRARNELLQGGALAESTITLVRLRRRVARSLLLRWSLSGIRIPTVRPSTVHTHDARGPDVGDIRHRLIEWLTEAEGISRSGVASTSGHEQHEQSLLLSAIPGLVEGMDVASSMQEGMSKTDALAIRET